MRRVVYRLPHVIPAEQVFVVEGEKDCDNLAALDITATTCPQGAGKWRADYNEMFKGKSVYILPDNDEPGQNHAATVASGLVRYAKTVKIINLPDLKLKGDISDWLSNGGTKDKLLDLAAQAAEFQPVPSTDIQKKDHQTALTEDKIAQYFAGRFKDDLRFCHHTGTWFTWEGSRWKREETRLAFDKARELCRELNATGKSILSKAATAAAVERFARADRVFAVTSELWDVDLMLLGTPGGVVDLRTGELRPAARADFITKQTSVSPSPCSIAPLWSKFLKDATREDEDLELFLRQMAGYCLTGEVSEHALFFVYGPGGNGKTVFVNTLANILGDYARTAAMDSFTASRSDRHPTDLAMLKGARLVTASETEEGRAWAESRIKQLTGGDTIAARFMRQDFFEFKPHFKLVLLGNYKPILRNVDDAARRRFNMIPFLNAPEAPDKRLEEKLKDEYPAILRWMIEGCLDWLEYGLTRPSVVIEATRVYFDDQDLFTQWLDECCDKGTGKIETTARLYSSWKEYSERSGELPGSVKTFSANLSRREFQADRATVFGVTQRIFRGISLIATKKDTKKGSEPECEDS
ncbi:MAG: phage/plasmid primase, P4 family [Syntrophobacteraceae bacterium]